MLDLLLLLLSLPSGVLKSLFAIVVATKVPAPQVSRVAVATRRPILLSRFWFGYSLPGIAYLFDRATSSVTALHPFSLRPVFQCQWSCPRFRCPCFQLCSVMYADSIGFPFLMDLDPQSEHSCFGKALRSGAP
jgi:hypothetical protein